jgi:8-oxo-dGTP pyrophosphatase MutT (NUDIX family)
MGANRLEPAAVYGRARAYAVAQPGTAVHRVRCVLRCDERFLLAQHYSRRAGRSGTWGLPGGRLKADEKPKAGLRRELEEELRVETPRLVKLGDWSYREENHRVFGCNLRREVEWFDADEIRAIAWLTYAEVAEFAAAERLQKGFELAAIAEFRRRFPR